MAKFRAQTVRENDKQLHQASLLSQQISYRDSEVAG